tara:strand:+ start:249 stop:515 length:267 start_codon:yes stop_codon:yes gene_type:complete
MVTTATTTTIDAASAIADAASATIISSAAAAWSSPAVHHRRPLAIVCHRRWRHQHLHHRDISLHIYRCHRHHLLAAAQQGEPETARSV